VISADPPEWSSIAVGRVATRLLQAGPHQASEAVVFVHGNPGSAGDWVRPVAEVGDLRRAVAFDLPDFGQTVAGPDFGHTINEYTEFLDQALDTLGISRPLFVLHDLGGFFGLRWAAANADRVAGVVLVDTGIMPDYRWHRWARVWQTRGLGELAQAVTTRAMFRRHFSKAGSGGLPPEFVDEMYENFDRRTKAAVLDVYRDSKSIAGDAAILAPILAPADLPALVVWGAGDPYLGSEYAELQKEAFPSAEVHVLPDSGHWPFIDDPATFSRLLVDFLRSIE
jgi:pimeloyl-ACP methyl ester carboxylesterase